MSGGLIQLHHQEFTDLKGSRFQKSLIRNLYRYLQSSTNQPSDYDAIYVFSEAVIKHGGLLLLDFLRMLTSAEHEIFKTESRDSKIIGNLVLSVFFNASKLWECPDLIAYIKQVAEERAKAGLFDYTHVYSLPVFNPLGVNTQEKLTSPLSMTHFCNKIRVALTLDGDFELKRYAATYKDFPDDLETPFDCVSPKINVIVSQSNHENPMTSLSALGGSILKSRKIDKGSEEFNAPIQSVFSSNLG